MHTLSFVSSIHPGVLRRHVFEFSELRSIRFFELAFYTDPDDPEMYIALRRETDSGVSVSFYEYEILKLLYHHQSDVSVLLHAHSKYPVGDCIRLLSVCCDAGVIIAVNAIPVFTPQELVRPQLEWIPARAVSWLVHPLFIVLIGLLCACMLFLYFLHPSLWPAMSDLIPHSNILVSFLILMLLDYSFVVVHELGHLLATIAVGGRGRINFISHRLFDLVLETESYGLSLVSRSSKYIVYVYGLFVDLIILSLSIAFLLISHVYFPVLDVYSHIFKLAIILTLLRMAWQTQVYLQTDFYNLITEYTREANLFFNSLHFGIRGIARATRRVSKRISHAISTNAISRYITLHSDRGVYFNRAQNRTFFVFFLLIFAGLSYYALVLFLYVFPRDILYVSLVWEKVVSHEGGLLPLEILPVIIFISLKYFYICLFSMRWIRSLY